MTRPEPVIAGLAITVRPSCSIQRPGERQERNSWIAESIPALWRSSATTQLTNRPTDHARATM